MLLNILIFLPFALAIPKNRRDDIGEGHTVSLIATGAAAQASSNAADLVGTNKGGVAQCQQNDKAHILDCDNRQTNAIGNGNPNITAGQAPSSGDAANFINFCSGKTVTNGLQNTAGSCNGIVMGDMPASNKMISSIILQPQPGEDVQADTTFNVVIQQNNLKAGVFTNPQLTYYGAPQQLSNGIVIGHTHITIEDLGGTLTPKTPPDPTKFKFFKGINDAGNGNGQLKAIVTNGLAPGFYRVCTMTSAANHQPVLMPVAQRGAQDDCTKFTVGQTGSKSVTNENSNGNTNNQSNTKSTTTVNKSSTVATSTSTGNSNNSGTSNGNSNGNPNNQLNTKSTTTVNKSNTAATTTSTGNSNNGGNSNGNRVSSSIGNSNTDSRSVGTSSTSNGESKTRNNPKTSTSGTTTTAAVRQGISSDQSNSVSVRAKATNMMETVTLTSTDFVPKTNHCIRSKLRGDLRSPHGER